MYSKFKHLNFNLSSNSQIINSSSMFWLFTITKSRQKKRLNLSPVYSTTIEVCRRRRNNIWTTFLSIERSQHTFQRTLKTFNLKKFTVTFVYFIIKNCTQITETLLPTTPCCIVEFPLRKNKKSCTLPVCLTCTWMT